MTTAAPVSPEISRDEESHSGNRLEQLLREARQEFLRSGEPMLDWDGLEREIAERRAGPPLRAQPTSRSRKNLVFDAAIAQGQNSIEEVLQGFEALHRGKTQEPADLTEVHPVRGNLQLRLYRLVGRILV